MGSECTRVSEREREAAKSLREDPVVSQLQTVKDVTIFSISIRDLQLLNFSQTFHTIRIQLENDFAFQLYSYDFQIHDKIWTSQKKFNAEIQGPLAVIANKTVVFSIQDKNGKNIDQLTMKLSHLSTGPIKHDHLLKNLKSRLLFDCRIDQYLDVEVALKTFNIAWDPSFAEEEQFYLLSLIFSNTKEHYDITRKYEKHEKIKPQQLQKITIKNSMLNEAIIRLKLTVTGHEEDHIQFYVPYAKFIESSSYKQKQLEHGVIEVRELALQEDVMMKGEKVGTAAFNILITKSKLYVEQMDCVVFSQNGIVTTTTTGFDNQKQELNGEVILKYLRRMREGKKQGISDYECYRVMEELLIVLKEGKEFHITDDLFKAQEAILDFMLELEDRLEENKIIKNEYIWKILNLLLHKKLMSLRYFGIINDQQAQVKYATKYYTFLVNVLLKVIRFITNGLSFKEVAPLQKFVAFAFFRFTWVQNEVTRALAKESDPVISQDKIAEIGASRRVKSPSKSYIYDWETNVFSLVRAKEDFLWMMSKLQKATQENPNWAGLLFDREYEQLFYGLFSELWDEAEIFLDNNGRIMWQYFPRYGDLLSIFFGQMNDSGILDFSAEMTRCNMKLIKNQKLLNTFMMLIFPKTCLFETYSVMKCLDLINCYFMVILDHNKKIPIDFNYNFFYTGIRCILQSSHSMLLQQMLSILYRYYDIFSKEFKETLNHYIINHVFNQLFMHWSVQVRDLFHLLLVFKISKNMIENPEINPKLSFGHFQERSHHSELISENVCSLRELRAQEKKVKKEKKHYYQNMKDKLELKIRKRRFSRMPSNESFDTDTVLGPPAKTNSDFSEAFMAIPLAARRKWSLAGNSEYQHQQAAPSEQQMKYLSISLRQFQEIKKEKQPDLIVEQRSKMLQINIDQ